MSAHEVITLMLLFGMFLLALLTLIVTIIKHWLDIAKKK